MSARREVTVVAPINIALTKYWGKRDTEKMIPMNDSISISIDALWARTKVTVVGADTGDSVLVNGKPMDVTTPGNRYQRCFNEIRRMAKAADGEMYFKVFSETNFPVQAGLASSAAGFAALAFGLGQLFDIDIDTICHVARLGSGSACRSVYEGFVHWVAGKDEDGADCRCEIVEPASHWPSLRSVIVVTSRQAKAVGSTAGMQETVRTSALMTHRVETCVPERTEELKRAIRERDFASFAKLTMRESNQLHAVCLDTYPPIQYMNESSWHLVRLVTAFNKRAGVEKVAYSFDAGPNCCLLMEQEILPQFIPYLMHYCPPGGAGALDNKFILNFDDWEEKCGAYKMEPFEGLQPMAGAAQYLIVSNVGGGPYVV